VTTAEPLLDVRVAQPCHIVPPVRIASLVPSATETLFALGLGDEVIAVTHECDHPDEVTDLPVLTRSMIPEGLSTSEIDTAVLERTQAGEAIYALDEELLAELEPDLIVTQALCAVFAVSYDDVVKVAARLPSHPRVISLDPRTLGEVLGDVRTIAEATDRRDAGVDLELRGQVEGQHRPGRRLLTVRTRQSRNPLPRRNVSTAMSSNGPAFIATPDHTKRTGELGP